MDLHFVMLLEFKLARYGRFAKQLRASATGMPGFDPVHGETAPESWQLFPERVVVGPLDQKLGHRFQQRCRFLM